VRKLEEITLFTYTCPVHYGEIVAKKGLGGPSESTFVLELMIQKVVVRV
jgi:hypothetical protein